MNDPWVIGALFGASLAALLWTLRVVTPSGALGAPLRGVRGTHPDSSGG